MINNKNGESLVGIIIGIFILSITIIGITNLITFNKDSYGFYIDLIQMTALEDNTYKIVNKIDTSKIQEKEIFFLYKDIENNDFKVFTGAENEQYKYIDELGNKIDDINSFSGVIYERTLWIDKKNTQFGEKNQVIYSEIKKK